MNVKKGWPTLSIELLFILHSKERKGVLEREKVRISQKLKKISKKILRKVAGCLGEFFGKV